jgi:hypothetical protein
MQHYRRYKTRPTKQDERWSSIGYTIQLEKEQQQEESSSAESESLTEEVRMHFVEYFLNY